MPPTPRAYKVGYARVSAHDQKLDSQLDALQTQGEISAAALAEGAVFETPGEPEYLIPDLGRQMLQVTVSKVGQCFERDLGVERRAVELLAGRQC